MTGLYAVTVGGTSAGADPAALSALAAELERGPLHGGLRTRPDGTLAAATDSERFVVALAMDLMRRGHLGVGIGIAGDDAADGAEDGPGASAAARAWSRTRSAPVPIVVDGPAHRQAALLDAQSALQLTGALVTRRSVPGHTAVGLMDRLGSQTEAAAVLGITRQAMSQRLRAAGWQNELAGRRLSERLLRVAAVER